MVSKGSFLTLLTEFGCEVDSLRDELETYLNEQVHLSGKNLDIEPKKTHSLERVFNRALTQVLFSGRQSLQVIDLFLSISAEDKSYSKYLFQKYGLEKNKLISLWNASFAETKTKKKSKNAVDALLEEYCDDLTELARQGKIDPIIGRNTEIDEIIHILAKRNKSNILMV
jgi:ATP-dependent Clp protease ATP-binding subunit ClpA